MDIFQFVSMNPWQTFFLGPFVIILFWMILIATSGSFNIVFRLVNRLLRTIKILVRGWPPEHLDADGDFKDKT